MYTKDTPESLGGKKRGAACVSSVFSWLFDKEGQMSAAVRTHKNHVRPTSAGICPSFSSNGGHWKKRKPPHAFPHPGIPAGPLRCCLIRVRLYFWIKRDLSKVFLKNIRTCLKDNRTLFQHPYDRPFFPAETHSREAGWGWGILFQCPPFVDKTQKAYAIAEHAAFWHVRPLRTLSVFCRRQENTE